MELYAAGLNAWNQLSFDNGIGKSESSTESHLEPDDVTSFTWILSAKTIECPVSDLSYTLGTQTLFSLDASERKTLQQTKELMPNLRHSQGRW